MLNNVATRAAGNNSPYTKVFAADQTIGSNVQSTTSASVSEAKLLQRNGNGCGLLIAVVRDAMKRYHQRFGSNRRSGLACHMAV